MSEQSQKIRIAMDLKKRQRDYLRLMATGETTKGIALVMKLAPKTVEWHRHCLYQTVNLHDYPSLTKLAIRLGLAEIDV